MKIVVAVANGAVSEHFGHAPEFHFYEIQGSDIPSPVVKPSPGHDTVSIPRWVGSQGVDCVIAGGIGQGAVDALAATGAVVVAGARGPVEDAVRAYLRGDLKPTQTGTHGPGEHGHGHHGEGCQCHETGNHGAHGHQGCGCH